jgi:hypothetical protein
MVRKCPICASTQYRRSRLRKGDFLRLFVLLYPVRCLKCSCRQHIFLLQALRFKPSPLSEHGRGKQLKQGTVAM